MATTTHQCITVCHYMVRYPFLYYSALFLWVFPYFTHIYCTFFMLLSFVLCLFMLHFFHVVFYLLCCLFTVRYFLVTLTIICVFTMLHYFNLFTLTFRLHVYMVCFFRATLFTICSFFILSSLHVAYIFFMWWFFHVALCSFFNFSHPVDPFSYCTIFMFRFFMLHLFHVVFYLLWCLFTVRCFPVTLTIICVFIMLHYFNLFTLFFRLHAYVVCFFPATLFTSCSFLILSSLHVAYFFMLWFFHVALCSFFNFSPPVDPFSCCTTFILHIFMLHIFFMLHF